MILALLVQLVTQDPGAAILGRWEGTSTCVKAPWNAACHDEVVRYDIVRDTVHAGEYTIHASKQVGTEWEWMGDVNVHWDSAGRHWIGEWSNTRFHLEWEFHSVGAGIQGTLMILPDRRKGRDIVLHR